MYNFEIGQYQGGLKYDLLRTTSKNNVPNVTLWKHMFGKNCRVYNYFCDLFHDVQGGQTIVALLYLFSIWISFDL